jgi:tetratricopeptide (TPR) repeat protein
MKYFIPLIVTLFMIAACSNEPTIKIPKDQLTEEIRTLKSDIAATEDAAKQKEIALQLAEKALLYGEQFPKDTVAPVLMFLAADAARGAGEFGKAVQLYGEIWRNHEKYDNAPLALFLQAFTYDSQLNDPEQAKEYYQKFLDKYPSHSLAEDVRRLIDVVGKKPEELVKEFEQNPQNDESK